MTDEELKKIFEKKKKAMNVSDCHAHLAVKNISRMIYQCQQNGMDIKLKTIGWANGLAFKFVPGGCSISVTGTIQIFDSEYLFVYASKSDGEECSKVFMSRHDMRYKHDDETRAYEFDLSEDLDAAFDEMAKILIDKYIDIASYRDQDIFNVLEYQPQRRLTPKKPGSSLSP